MKKTKVLSILLAVAVMVSMMPMAVFADGGDELQPISVSYDSVYSEKTESLVAYYNDDYFKVNPSTYNSHLATTSMALAMASGCYEDTNVKTLFADMGYTGVRTSDYGTDTANTIGVALARKEISTGTYVVPVAIRGINYYHEWSRNLEVGKSGEAKGYADAAKKVVTLANEYVKEVKAEGAKTVYLWLTGYSRGAAVADVAAKTLTDKYGMDKVYAYCFEGPAAGTKATTNKYYTNIHNVLNSASGIKVVMPAYMNFALYGPVDRSLGGGDDAAMLEMLKQVNSSFEYSSPKDFKWAKMKFNVDFNSDGWMGEVIAMVMGGGIDKLVTITSGAKSSQPDFWTTLMSRLKKVFPTRASYTTGIAAKTKAAATSLGVEAVTYEQAAMILGDMFMNEELDLAAIPKSITGSLIKLNSTGALPVLAKSIGAIQKGKAPSLNNAEYSLLVDSLVTIVSDSGSYTDAQKTNLKKMLCALTDPLLKFMAYDYTADKQVLGTLLNNTDRLTHVHYADVNMAWLMTEDSYYNGSADTKLTVPKAAKLSKATSSSKAFTAKWKKVSGISGYQIAYSRSSNMKNPTIKNVAKSKTSYKVSKLSKKKTYYVKIRTYKTIKVGGKSVKSYSKWSSYKKVKTK